MINHISRMGYRPGIGLFIVRVMAGLIFLTHGWMKLSTMPMTASFFHTLGLPAWVAWFIALLEVIGGAALILGVATRLFGLLFGIEMIVSVFLTGVSRGFHAHELELLLAASSLAIAAAGSGAYSLWKMECKDCGGMMCNNEKGVCPIKS